MFRAWLATCLGVFMVGASCTSKEHEFGAGAEAGMASEPPASSNGGSGAGGGETTDTPSEAGTGDSAAPAMGGAPERPAVCGDQTVDAGETCDDGNTDPKDGCSAKCKVEPGWACDQGGPTVCTPVCGDGLVLGAEAQAGGCDDGHAGANDGCTDSCKVEPGWVCLGAPSTCNKTCGNGQLDAGETCEDGNQVAGDGCLACVLERGFACDNATLPSKCADIDECKAGGGNDCGANATCTNSPGSYTCACKPGYGGNGVTCSNVDECMLNTDNCDAHADCTDTAGSFTCKCKPGYVGNGLTCARTSCVGLTAGCGQFGADDCCAAPTVIGGPNVLGETIVTFALDKYEVTVGRFKKFLNSYTGHPANGAGADPETNGSGWQSPAWDSLIAATKADLGAAIQCNSTYQTFVAGVANDYLPMNCVSWYEAMAFCAWDGGWLPHLYNWQYAAMGGNAGWNYPWGNAPVPTNMLDSTAAYANYDCLGDGSAPAVCAFTDILRVGSKPAGAGKFGQLDLAGSLFEWSTDECDNCSGPAAPYRYILGGSFSYPGDDLASTAPRGFGTATHDGGVGFRCARAP